jgi:hypothetical protein
MRKIVLFILSVFLFFNVSAQTDKKNKSITMGFCYRNLFIDMDKLNDLIPINESLPLLNSNVRFHGGTLYGDLTNWLSFGFSAYGALNQKSNDYGYTNWSGAMAGFYADIHKELFKNFYIGTNFTFSCGRFNFSSMNNNGVGINMYTDVFMPEPGAGIKYVLADKLLLKVDVSTIFSVFETNKNLGTNSDEFVKPKGIMLTFTVGYKFRSKKKD